MSDTLETKQEDRVLRIWLNRPANRNVLSFELCQQLIREFERADRDNSVGSILLAGRGDSFCAGMDLKELANGNVERISSLQEALFTIGARLAKPVIGAVQGVALASGTGLVANCHVVIAADNATFGLPGIRMGLWPFVLFPAISAAVGERRATALSITGEVFNAAVALQIGLIHQVVSIDELEPRAVEVAHTVANYNSIALRAGLGFVHGARGQTWKAAAGTARLLRDEFLEGGNFQETLAAYLNQK